MCRRLERLCALVPAPRRHLVTYHGVLAGAALDRDRVVPAAIENGNCRYGGEVAIDNDEEPGAGPAATTAIEQRSRSRRRTRFVPHQPRRSGGRPRYAWAELLRRVFLVDVLECPHCGGRRRLLAAIHDPAAIERVLAALGLSGEVPQVAAARPPPQEE